MKVDKAIVIAKINHCIFSLVTQRNNRLDQLSCLDPAVMATFSIFILNNSYEDTDEILDYSAFFVQ